MIWGTSFVAGKLGVESTDPFLFTALRAAFSALSIVPFFLLYRFDYTLFKDRALWGIASLNALGMILQNVGLTQTTASNTVLLVDINVVIVAVLASFVLKERLDRRIVTGLVLGMTGVVLIATKGDLSSLGGGTFLGDLLVFMAGVSWAFYIVFTTRELRKGRSLLYLTCTVVVQTSLLAMPVGLVLTADLSLGAPGVLMALYTGIFCTTVAFLLYNVGLRSLGATTTSIILLVEMVFGLLFSFLLLGERPDAMTALGGSLILSAIMVISVKGLERSMWKRSRS
jgi:drug/metabolite transporter (DMT)-like permease